MTTNNYKFTFVGIIIPKEAIQQWTRMVAAKHIGSIENDTICVTCTLCEMLKRTKNIDSNLVMLDCKTIKGIEDDIDALLLGKFEDTFCKIHEPSDEDKCDLVNKILSDIEILNNTIIETGGGSCVIPDIECTDPDNKTHTYVEFSEEYIKWNDKHKC